jgi:hypothetical protein
MRTLTDEVSYNGSLSPDRGRLLARLRKLQDQAALFANLAAGGGQFQAVVAEYRNCFSPGRCCDLNWINTPRAP